MIPRRMAFRFLLVAVALLTACDESDPATSQHCIEVRMRAIELAYVRTQNVRAGNDVLALDIVLAKLQNENWACFK